MTPTRCLQCDTRLWFRTISRIWACPQCDATPEQRRYWTRRLADARQRLTS